MANDIDKTSPHYKGDFGSIYEVNKKFPTGGVAGDFVVVEGWAHYWNADRASWCVNAERDSYWDELITNIIEKFKLVRGATYMGVASLDTVPAKAIGAKMYYFATVAGTYKNFGDLVVPQGINVLYSENGSSWVNTTLLEVAQELGVSTKKVVSQKALNDALNLKADQSSVNEALAKKADKETVKTELAKKADKETVKTELAKKADKEAVDKELDKKADKTNVAFSLDLKANKTDVAKENAKQDAEINRKANQHDVESALNSLRKDIGERTVIDGNVENNPDEEDLTSKSLSNGTMVLSLKDRDYNPLEYSGKGYKILRKNLHDVTCAITKIQVTKVPAIDGYVSIIINGVETHVDLVASTDNTVALVAKKIADKLYETLDEYVTSIDGALVTCTRRFGGDVTTSSFSGVNTGSEAAISESSKTELRNLITPVMISEPNTIYEIRYDFDLNGETIEMKEGCTFKFNGGSFINANIILQNNCKIVNGRINIAGNALILLNNNCTIENCTFTHVSWCKNGYGTLFAENKENIKIHNCTFKKQKKPAKSEKCSSIDLRNCKDFIINNITSYYSEGENIIVKSGSGIVSNSVLYNGWSGIGTNHYGASDSTPITEGDGTSSIIISNNIVINAIAAGITINSDNVICSNNQILWFGKDEDNKTIVRGPGIRLGHSFTYANNCLIDNNIIKWGKFVTSSGASTSDRGISLDAGNNNIIQNNYIQGVLKGIGSSVTKKQGTIIKNNNINAIMGGIVIYNDINCTIENNNINVKQGTGLWSHLCDSVIKSNTVKFSDGIPDTDTLTDEDYCGFLIETGNNNCTISNNFVVAHNSLKIDTTDSKDVILTNNRFKSQKDYRIDFTCENLIYKGNDICNQSIKLPKKAYVDNNRIFGCSVSAIRIEKCIEHIITNNHFATESNYAVSIYITNTTEIERCIINNNTCSSGTAFCQKEALSYYGNKLKTGFSPSYKDEINPLFFLNGQVVDSQGYPEYLIRGKSYNRPTLTENHAGAEYYDVSLKKKILWNGTEWTNVDGTTLS